MTGLAECRGMERELAQVASTKSGNLYIGLYTLEEHVMCCFTFLFCSATCNTICPFINFTVHIFQRVCKKWSSVTSRHSTPFLRNVVLSTDFLLLIKLERCRFWSLAENATTLMISGCVEKKHKYSPVWKPARALPAFDILLDMGRV